MLADPTLLTPPALETARLDRQALLNVLRRNTTLPALSSGTEESARSLLLEYADFLLEQEACYCQQ